jgi:signal transduction histidine kinase
VLPGGIFAGTFLLHGVRHFEVRLWAEPDEIHLTINDSGVGFDRQALKESRSVGLVSMEEPLKLLHGLLLSNCNPTGGTTVHARVPFRSDNDATLTAG